MRRCLPLLALTAITATSSTAMASPFAMQSNTIQDPAPPTLPNTSGAAPAPGTAAPATAAPATAPTTAAPAAAPAPTDTTAPTISGPADPAADPNVEPAPDPTGEGPANENSTQMPGEDPTTGDGDGDVTEESLEDARALVADDTWNAHAIGVRGGLTVVPTWILSGFLASHTNSLCRGETLGDFGIERGLTRMDGCNWYVGGEYVYRKSKNLDIVAAMGWQKMKTPDGYWLDSDEWGSGCTVHDPANGCNLAAADYTEIDVSFFFIEADFIGRGTVAKGKDLEFQIGGGGGLGIGILLGRGVFQTPIGGAVDPTDGVFKPASPLNDAGDEDFDSCTTIQDLGDFRACAPHYFDDPDTDQNGDGMENSGGDLTDPDTVEALSGQSTLGPGQFAQCDDRGCNPSDLSLFGSRFEQGDVIPVVPVVNIIMTARLIIKDTVGINLTGGFNTGFYFGGSMQYFFGGGGGAKKGQVSKFFKPTAKSMGNI